MIQNVAHRIEPDAKGSQCDQRMINDVGRFFRCAVPVAVSTRRDQLGHLFAELLEPKIAIG